MSDTLLLPSYPSAAEARAHIATEEELIEWRLRDGHRVVQTQGRYWFSIRPGFFQPLHPLARLQFHEVRCPTRFSWGYRAALVTSDAHRANGCIPVHLIRDLASWDERSLSRRKREQLRQSLRTVSIVQLTDSRLLEEQGYDVYLSFAKRVGMRTPVSREVYLGNARAWNEHKRSLILAGVVDERLLGYLEAYATEGTMYVQQVHLTAEAGRANLAAGLYYQAINAFKRTGKVCEVVGGLHTPENPSLMEFKRRMGFEVIQIPARCHIHPLPSLYLRRRHPRIYYRLAGGQAGSSDLSDSL